MARPFLAELAVITDTVVATQQTDDSRSCRISAEAFAAGGFNSSGTPSLMNRQAEQTADQAAENMARIHQEIEDTKSAQTVALSEGEAVVAAALGEMVASAAQCAASGSASTSGSASASGSVADVQKNEDAAESDDEDFLVYESRGIGWSAWWAEQNKKNCEFFGVRVSKCTKCSTALLDCDLTKLGVRGRCEVDPSVLCPPAWTLRRGLISPASWHGRSDAQSSGEARGTLCHVCVNTCSPGLSLVVHHALADSCSDALSAVLSRVVSICR